jgi:hypothetical protein
MHRSRIAGLLAHAAIALSLAGCGNTKMRQENEQLQNQILQLQKDNGDLGNRIEEATAAQEALAKENEQLKDQNNALKARRATTKTIAHRRRRHRKTSSARSSQ